MDPLPLVRPLGETFSMAEAFSQLSDMPARLWFDSAARGPELEPGGDHAGRYSFLCADPVDQIVAYAGDENPWPKLKRWCRALPTQRVADLPPFQGGIAGLWGYEAGGWLESVGHAPQNDLPTAAVSVGLYDWVICCDHLRSQAWLVSWGLCRHDLSLSAARAKERMNTVLQRLDRHVVPMPANQPAPPKPDAEPLAGSFPTHWPNVWSNFSSADFRAAVGLIIQAIGRGDLFQANLSQRLVTPARSDADSLALRLRDSNPAPFAAFYDGGSFQVISSSPEGFLRLRNGVVQTRPIKGTVARTGEEAIDRKLAAGLVASEKERAENVMIVDLMRNDLSRVCEDDSVRVSKLCGVESYAHVQHLVSVVEGSLRKDVSAIDLLEACFPGGSVTGAPKIEAMKTIARLEPVVRGPYCGSLGYVSCGGDAEFNILIRTITASAGWWQIPVGGGITLRSDPAAEESETWIKAEGMLRAIG